MRTLDYVFLGVGSHAVALNRSTGTEVWRRRLKSSPFVTISFDGQRLFAASAGQVFCLDPSTGEVRWQNKLPRLGTGVVSFTDSTQAGMAATMAANTVATSTAAAAATAG